MKKDVSTVVINSNQTRVSSSYTYNQIQDGQYLHNLQGQGSFLCNHKRVQRFGVGMRDVQAYCRHHVSLVPTDT